MEHPPPFSRVRAIDFLDGPPTYSHFVKLYQRPGSLHPVIFRDDNFSEAWQGCKDWIAIDGEGKLVPNIDTIAKSFPKVKAPVVVLNKDALNQSSYGEESRTEMSFEEFTKLWKSSNGDMLYLKDFHLCLARPDMEIYEPYPFFRDDWMNAHALHCTKDDFRFLYLGNSGTTTGLHHDVYLSHSWSTSLCGVKCWTLLAPEHVHLLNHVHTKEPYSSWHILPGDNPAEYPELEEARNKSLTVWQYPGETMFIPSGWYHSVENFGPTLSINHNWANFSCIEVMFDALCGQVDKSAELLFDLRPTNGDPTELFEFWELVYNNLVRPSWGWNFADFWEMIEWIVEHPTGGYKWRIYAEEDMKVEGQTVKRCIASMCRRWMQSEEARVMHSLRARVEMIARKCSDV